MRITYACPACHASATIADVEQLDSITCPSCRATLPVLPDALPQARTPGQPLRLARCLICPSTELFVRKDFPQRLGVGIVVAGLAASCVAWANRELLATFGILFGTALLDLVLYFLVPNCLTCYRCQARYAGSGVTAPFVPFDLETHEKHRQFVARTAAQASDASASTR
jgi:hypothetical protein